MYIARILLLILSVGLQESNCFHQKSEHNETLTPVSPTDPNNATSPYVTGYIELFSTRSTDRVWQAPTVRPWYINDLPDLNRSFSVTNRTYFEFLEIKQMLLENDLILNSRRIMYGFSFIISNFMYRLIPIPEIKALVSELDLCSQNNVLNRISCRDRCGEVPESRNLPAQCGCDMDCFMHGDCCEDMDKFCIDVFVQATKRFFSQNEDFSLRRCFIYGWRILLDLYISKYLGSSVEPKVFEIDCVDAIEKKDVLQDILDALQNSRCTSKSFAMDQTTHNRVCQRPQVLACVSPTLACSYDFYPIHLLCQDNDMTEVLTNRYSSGLTDMEILSEHGNCSLMRERSSTTAWSGNGNSYPTNLWRKDQLKKMKLTVVFRDGQHYFNFETAQWRRVRCTGGPAVSDWTCEDNECFDNQFFDERSQTCYWPDYAYLQVTHLSSPFTSKTDAQNRIPVTNTNDKSNTISNQSGVDNSEAIDQFSSSVQLCSCLKAQAVLSSVGWWQVFIDTGELMKGRCGFELNAIHTKAYESQNSQRKNFSDTGTFLNNSTDAVRVERLTGIRFLSQELPKLWWSRRNDCSVDVYTAISVCFTNIPLVGLEIKCSYLQNLLVDDVNGINNMIKMPLGPYEGSGCIHSDPIVNSIYFVALVYIFITL